MGAAYVLDALWRRLGIDKTLRKLISGSKRAGEVERVLFALVANRAIDPSSKVAATSWVRDRVRIDGLDDVDADACYWAMDWLLEVEEPLAEAVFWATVDLLNPEVDCCSSTPPPPTSRSNRPTIPPWERRSGSAPTATPRTIGRTCPRSSWGWPSPGAGSRSRCGPGPATPTTPHSSAKSKTTFTPGGWAASCGSRIGGSRQRRTAATSSGPGAATSSVRSSAAAPPKPTPHWPAKAATTPSRAVSRSRRSCSTTASCGTGS